MKRFYQLGSLVIVVAPIAAVVSCGHSKNQSAQNTLHTIKDNYSIKSVNDMNNVFLDANYQPKNDNTAETILKSLQPNGNWNFAGKTFKNTDTTKSNNYAVVLSGPEQVPITAIETKTYEYTKQMLDDSNADNTIVNNIEKLYGIKKADIETAYAIIFLKTSSNNSAEISYSPINPFQNSFYLQQTIPFQATIIGQEAAVAEDNKPIKLPTPSEQAKKDLADIVAAQSEYEKANADYEHAKATGGDSASLAGPLANAKAKLQELNKAASAHLSDIFFKNISAEERTKFPQGTRGFVIDGTNKNLVFFEPFNGSLGFHEIKTLEPTSQGQNPTTTIPMFFYVNTMMQGSQGSTLTQSARNNQYYSIKENYQAFAWTSKDNRYVIDNHYKDAFDYIKTFYEFDKFKTINVNSIIASLKTAA